MIKMMLTLLTLMAGCGSTTVYSPVSDAARDDANVSSEDRVWVHGAGPCYFTRNDLKPLLLHEPESASGNGGAVTNVGDYFANPYRGNLFEWQKLLVDRSTAHSVKLTAAVAIVLNFASPDMTFDEIKRLMFPEEYEMSGWELRNLDYNSWVPGGVQREARVRGYPHVHVLRSTEMAAWPEIWIVAAQPLSGSGRNVGDESTTARCAALVVLDDIGATYVSSNGLFVHSVVEQLLESQK